MYVSPSGSRPFGLAAATVCPVRFVRRKEKYLPCFGSSHQHQEPDKLAEKVVFRDLTPLHAEERIILETTPEEVGMRIIDLVTPIGKGQRGLIVAPPRTGKTVLLQKFANAISTNHPEIKMIVLLIDEHGSDGF